MIVEEDFIGIGREGMRRTGVIRKCMHAARVKSGVGVATDSD